MRGDFEALNALLSSRYQIGLEEALCEGCLMARLNAALASAARIVPALERFEREEDGGEFRVYSGIFVFEDVWYRFRCHLFIDASGQSFLSHIAQFEAVKWQVQMAM
jgi:hypothetical protein